MRQWFLCAMLLPAMLSAQGPGTRGPGPRGSWWEMPWWNSPLVRSLDLSTAQRSDMRNIVRDYRARLMDLRAAVEKADGEMDAAFSENPVDQRKANDAIDHLANARADLTRTLSQMTLKLRSTLTSEQWQELQRRSEIRRPGKTDRGRGPGMPPNPPSGNFKQ